MIKPFFPPIRATFRRRKGWTLSDQDLLWAWRGVSTDAIRAMVDDPDAGRVENQRVRATRQRVIDLREPPSDLGATANDAHAVREAAE